MSTGTKQAFGYTGLAVLAVLFVALTMLSSSLFRGARLDLTENRLYTVSEGTRNILANIDEPINLYFYYSDKATRNVPPLRTYAVRVRELLEEFALRSGGKIRLEVIDPLPFSEEEDDASRFGLQGIPLGASGEQAYMGLVGTNSVDDESVIPFFAPDKEPFLEYDLAKLVYSLDNPKPTVIGLITPLPIAGGFDPQSQRPREGWAVLAQLEQLFEVRSLGTSVTSIDDDVDVLMLVHPKSLSDESLYAIDQFIMRGGRALIAVDPHAEIDIPPQDPQNPTAAMFADRSSNLARLFEAYGIVYDPANAVLDQRLALSVAARRGDTPMPHYGILSLTADNLNEDDPVSEGLASINVAVAGSLSTSADAEITLEPLLTSSTEAMTTGAERFRFLPDPAELIDGFASTGERYVLGARLVGTLNTAFPGGLTDAPPDSDDPDAAATAQAPEGHLEASDGPANLIVLADVDVLSDRLWVQVQNFFGQQLLSPFANNGDFVINALDNLTGSNDLISIRGRATYSRPFERVADLRRRADADFRAKEQELLQEVSDLESRLSELQSSRSDDSLLILSDEQSAEIEQFQQTRSEKRAELRQVRRDLNRDIERLGTWLKVLNIGLVPLLLIAIVLFGVVRGRRTGSRAASRRGARTATEDAS